ncbi:hypothetical protein Y046_6314 [Burkholderia pseudomallei MSHR2990]|nr:hypothetical protein Y046_6314 [Burkholderia pseudomallei MSHR2990]
MLAPLVNTEQAHVDIRHYIKILLTLTMLQILTRIEDTGKHDTVFTLIFHLTRPPIDCSFGATSK